ncbi:MAG: DUF922 domain-containing protein [Flavisolibacter sp.]|nr:DUF922 domain-containing protein [Flavisolibacter sp.]
MTSFYHLFTAALMALYIFVVPHTAQLTSKVVNHKTTDVLLAKKESEDEELIPWMVQRRLIWDDFLCEPKRNTDAVASTSTTLGLAYQMTSHGFTYDISCNFSKLKSWGLVKTPYILAHEQGHFDITELFARKLYQAMANYPINVYTYKQDINDIYNRIVAEKEAFQAAYDGQTDHSRNKLVQIEWLKRIHQLLEETEAYANYP